MNEKENHKQQINVNYTNILDFDGDETNKIEIFQEKVKKMFLEKEKNKLKKRNYNKINSDDLKPDENDILKISNKFKNISYENIHKKENKNLLNTIDKNDDKDNGNGNDEVNNDEYNDIVQNKNNIKKEEMKCQTKNDKDINKEERNKILLKLLVNKELSRITSISKELRKQTKPNKKEDIDIDINKNIIKEEKENEDNEIVPDNKNKKENINKVNLDIKNEEKVENEDLAKIEEKTNIESKSKKKDTLKIIELLKLKNSNKNSARSTPEKDDKVKRNEVIISNINTKIDKNENKKDIKEELTNEDTKSKLVISKKEINFYKGNILHRFINKKNDNIENINNNINYRRKIYSQNNSKEKDNNKNVIMEENENRNKNNQKNNIYIKNKNQNQNQNKKFMMKINLNKNNSNFDEKRRKKLENDLAKEISKIEISGEWNDSNSKNFNNIIYKKNNRIDQNIKTKDIIFSKNNIKKEKSLSVKKFDKNETISLSLLDMKNNEIQNQTQNKVYSKKNLVTNKDIKYKTNHNFFKKNKIPRREMQLNANGSKQLLEQKIYNTRTNKNNNIFIYNKSKNRSKNQFYNKSFGYNENDNYGFDSINNENENKRLILNQNNSFDYMNTNLFNNNNIKHKKINYYLNSINNSSFADNNNIINNINFKNNIYVKKNTIDGCQTTKKHRNKSVKYIKKNSYIQFDSPNIFLGFTGSEKYIKQTPNRTKRRNTGENIKYENINNNYFVDNATVPFLSTTNNKILFTNKNGNNNIIIFMIEELLVLEDKLSEIIISLNTEKSISNYCFDFWNYFYNSTLFSKFEIIFKNSNDININTIKLTINLILFTIMICYDFSFESNNLINIYLFLSELLELNHRNLILILEHISNQIIINNKDNNWIIRAYNIINNFNLTEDNECYYKNANYAEIIISKINKNINSVTQKINYILLTNKTNFNECLIKLFNKINLESFTDIDEFFKEYLLRENFIECSVTAKTFLKENSILEPENAPYIKNANKKKFSLVLDLDETLISFKLNREQNDEGVLKLRPNLYKFLDNVMEYYEIILFTEASQSYIDLLINALEENKKYFEYKLYRQHTVIRGNDFIKDLTRIGRPLNSIIIVDNMPQNFRLQKGNGINIKSFWGEDDEEDNSLLDLMTILINIAKEEEDVRNGIIKYHDEIITKITSNLYKHNKY